ncbi:AAA family ATPase [Chryseobacterium indologenes]|uniref:AAA family ATPase n=1 Tax=Chryseobacterium indologenes TaxID=253 RepID=UPI0009A23149|nr:AAA family ATPase [Chryseobacterium indologenes]
MKIKSLWVSEYKNLKDINLVFNSNLITLLVGKNGLGKSNLIEILALIFKNLDLFNNVDDFISWTYDTKNNFQFIINYECYQDDILIKCNEKQFSISTRSINSTNNTEFSIIPFKDFLKDRSIRYIPKYIIGYYSGENKRIKSIIKEHEDKQKEILKTFQRNKKEEKEEGLRKLFFTENYHSQLLILTLVLFRGHSTFKSKIDDLFINYIGIESIENFTILFNNPDWNYKNIDGKNKGMEYLISNINDKEYIKNPFWNLKGKIDSLLTRFYNHQIDNSVEPIYYDNEGDDKRNFVNEFLLFDKIVFETFITEIIEYYPHPVDFFDAIESAVIVDILHSITFEVKKKDIKDSIRFDQLSEGEQQLLTVLSLLLVVSTDECLFLLDEPDTHLNPEWQRDYIELLRKFNTNDFNSHIFVATHSPLIVQSSIDSEILLHRKEGDEIIIEESEIEFDTWRIDHVLTSKYFGLESARPKNEKIDSFFAMRKLFLEGKLSEKEKEEMKKLREGHLFPSGETYNDLIALSKILKKDGPNQ